MGHRSTPAVVLVVGPTATGKSDIGIDIALSVNGEIISADSMQIYRGLDIGTAKLSASEMRGVAHYGIDLVEPGTAYSVAEYQAYARARIDDIWSRGKVPILVGGTGLYIRAVLEPMTFAGTPEDTSFRSRLQQEAAEVGSGPLYARLLQADPESASRIAPADVRRIIRALEVFELTGVPLSRHHRTDDRDFIYQTVGIALDLPRALLYDRIDARVDRMMERGLLEEVRGLMNEGYTEQLQAMQAIGYKELLAYFRGIASLDEAVASIKQSSRRYAKRQLSWFRRMDSLDWRDPRHAEGIVQSVQHRLAGIRR